MEVRRVLPPLQKEDNPEMFAVGNALTFTAKVVDIEEQPLLLVIVTEYEPAIEAE